MASKHLYWLDPLRFFAALLVSVSHIRAAVFVEYGQLAPESQSIGVAVAYAITRISNEAVILFFVLSGFLVGGRALEKMTQGTFVGASYAVDRISRIAVPLLPALLFTGCVLYMREGHWDIGGLIANVLSLQGIATEAYGGNEPLWSLAYEVWFYVLAFIVGYAVTKKSLSVIALTGIVTVFLVFCYLEATYLLCWLVGSAVYFIKPSSRPRFTLVVSLVVMTIAVLGVQLTSGSRSFDLGIYGSWLPPIEACRVLLAAALAVFVKNVIILKPQNGLMAAVDKSGTFMAKSSYTLYLVHFPIIQLLQYWGLEQANTVNSLTVLQFFSIVLICLLFAGGFYLLFEKHTLTVRNWLKRRHAVFRFA